MTAELRELYQEVVLDHGRQPRNFGAPPSYTHKLEGFNPLCGDELTVYLRIAQGVIEDVHFHGNGCAISMASASLMTEALQGQRVETAMTLFDQFHAMLMTGNSDQREQLGKLVTLAGVSEFPSRIKCATLAWHALKGALTGESHHVTTE